jgi:hypothetical protein
MPPSIVALTEDEMREARKQVFDRYVCSAWRRSFCCASAIEKYSMSVIY